MLNNRKTRRQFLQGMGGFTLSLPFLPSLMSRIAQAQVVKQPTVFISMYSVNGQRKQYWEPFQKASRSLTGFSIKDLDMVSAFAANGISPTLGSKFVPYLKDLTFIKGLDFVPSLGHNNSGMLGNFDGATPTIDQFMSRSPSVYGSTEPAIRSLLTNNGWGQSFSYGYSGAALVNLPAFIDPRAAFDRVFFTSNAAGKAKHTKVVDLVKDDYTRLKTNARISKDDKLVLDQFLAGLSDIENRINKQQPFTGPIPARPAAPVDGAAATKAHIDLIISAIKCGATRVATLSAAWNPVATGGDWHGPSHNREEQDTVVLRDVNRWIAENIFLEIVKGLDSPSPDGKRYLDSAIVYWGNEMSIGWSHVNWNMPVLLAGGGGGNVRPGRLIDYTQYGVSAPGGEVNYGRPINQLFVSLLQSMGIPASEYETNGKKSYGQYTVSSPERMKVYQNVIPEISQPLPYLA